MAQLGHLGVACSRGASHSLARCAACCRYRQSLRECTVVQAASAEPLEPSLFCRLLPEDAAAAAAAQRSGLQVSRASPCCPTACTG